ncbi:endo-beta-N-acetylglucosaminidase [Pseudomonas arsenicoxydans]|uniref:Cytosolic endo-beta-N-acetylglucosaminidase TIM barrel domain-containing protein n=1 Tax=Pseudomonas arsenicoxydans TaxID=702115 RepID=A0A502GXG9_9PSED|nr:hypothetical protein [Pseudomonas arsenicoxydans]TPG65706.1 hypothetical protein EAH78_31420 [Pseudomonas arsenicoxydans]
MQANNNLYQGFLICGRHLMGLHLRLFGVIAGLLLSTHALALNTFTWALDSDPARNSDGYESIFNVDPDNLNGYLAPSTNPLSTQVTRQWMDRTQTGTGKEFAVIYRTRPASLNYPDVPSGVNPVTFENWAFIRKFINFGGEALSGSHISAPDPEWVSAAHRNGVKVYGTVYIDSANGTLQMTSNLLGHYNNNGETVKLNYSVPVLDKLAALAKKLNLDGWFLNIENGLTPYNVSQLKLVVNNLFPAYLENGVEFIAYTGATNQGIQSPKLITDDDIANFDNRPADHPSLDNATGIDPGIVNINDYPVNSQKTYLMFLDGVFTRNTNLGQFWPQRVAAAKATQCQFFKGRGNWPGFQRYAQAVYPITTLPSDVLCAGNPTSLADPEPTVVLKVTLPSGVSVTPTLHDSVPCYDKCFYEYTYSAYGAQREKLTFNVSFSRINTSYGSYRSPSNQRESLYAQNMPGSKWWGKFPSESGSYIWNYNETLYKNGSPYVIINPPSGAYCWIEKDKICTFPTFFPSGGLIGNYQNTQNTGLPVAFPQGYQHDQFGNFGSFPKLNYVMNVEYR